ncbi:condensation domain-containing protein [Streptomyces rubiginosohelvolus]
MSAPSRTPGSDRETGTPATGRPYSSGREGDGTSPSVEAKRARLRALLRPVPTPGVRHRDRPQRQMSAPALTLTPEQRGLLFLNRLDPDAGLYDIPVAVALHGPLDGPRLARAFDALLARHPSLATRVELRPDGPVLSPAPEPPRLELRAARPREEDPLDTVMREAARPLDTERSVLRAVMFSSAPDEHHLLLVAHHLVFDGHSSVVVLEDLWALYRAEGEDDDGELPSPGASFSEYAASRACLAPERERELTAFWRGRTKGVTGAPSLPFDFSGGGPRTRRAGSVGVRVEAERTSGLRSFAAEQRCSLFAVLLASYLLVLGRYDPDRRLAVGTPAGIRHEPRFDRTVGCLINMVPVRAPAPDGPGAEQALTSGAYVRAVREELTAALDHADLPFPRIAELLDDGIDPEEGSPFTCPFAFQVWRGDTAGEMVVPGVRAEIVEAVHQPGVGHVNLTLVERDDEIRGHLKYDLDRFTRTSALRYADEWVAVASALADRPDDPVREVLRDAVSGTAGAAPPPPDTGPDPAPDADASAPSPSADSANETVGDPAAARSEDDPAAYGAALADCRQAWRALLEVGPSGEEDPPGRGSRTPDDLDGLSFFTAGGDSILAVQLVARLRQAGHELSTRDVFRNATPRELARVLAGRAADGRAAGTAGRDRSSPDRPLPAGSDGVAFGRRAPGSGEVPALSPVQSWFFERVATERQHWNQSVALRMRRPVDPLLLRLALQAVLDAHPALTSPVEPYGTGHRVRPGAPVSGTAARELLTVADGVSGEEGDRLWARAQQGLDPATGSHLRALLLRGTPEEPHATQELRLTAHHLVVDAVSWGILLADLDHALDLVESGELPRPLPEPTTERDWAGRLARSAHDVRGAEFWRATSEARRECDGLLSSGPPGPEGEARHEETVLGREVTRRLLTEAPGALDRSVHAVLTGAVGLALARWRGCRMVTFDVETHGRPDGSAPTEDGDHGTADLSRTVGWLTSVDPVVLSGPREADAWAYLRETAPALAARPPCPGFLTYRHLSPDPGLRAELATTPRALVSFNYFGQTDRLLLSDRFLTAEPPSGDRSERAERLYAAEVYAVVRDGRMRVGLTWSPSRADGLDHESARALMAHLDDVLTELGSEHAVTAGEPSDPADRAAPRGEARWPLTPQQYGVVVESLVAPVPGRHVEQFQWWWRGTFDRECFQRAWEVLFRRHTVLRAAIDDGTEPGLYAAASVLPSVDWLTEDGGGEASDASWREVARHERARGFAANEAPLLRVTVRAEPEGHRLLMTFHHALLDGWSVALLLEQLYEEYLAALAGHPGTDNGAGALPDTRGEQRPDLRDHAGWLAGRDTEAARAWWAERLSGREAASAAVLPGTPDASGGPGPAEGTGLDGDRSRAGDAPPPVRAEIDGASMDVLRVWAAQHAATESNVLQAVWAALLWRCAAAPSADDTSSPARGRVRFGMTLSGRTAGTEGVRGIAGMLATSLPLDLPVDPDEPVSALVERAREAALDLQDHEWASAGQVHEWAGLPGGTSLFDSLLVVENYPASLHDVGRRLAESGADVEVPTAVGARTAYALTTLAHRLGSDLVLDLVTDPQRIGAGDAARLRDLWAGALRRLAADPDGTTVAGLVAGVTDADLPRVAPRTPVTAAGCTVDWPGTEEDREVVRAAFAEVLGVAEVAAGDNFYELGGHSLLSVRLLRALAARGADSLTLGDLLRRPRAGELAHLVAEHRTGGAPRADTSVLVPLRDAADGDTSTLYLVHPPGGQVACYGELAARFPGSAALVGIQDPRVTAPGPAQERSVRDLARAYADALPAPAAGERRVLAGFSGGGIIAYELARVLESEGLAPDLVVLLDAAAPTGRLTDTAAEGSFLRRVEAHTRATAPPEDLTPSTAPQDATPDDYLDELARVAEWMGNGGPDPFALLRTSLRAVEAYRPGPYPGPLLVLRASETDFGRGSTFDASDTYYARPAMGWEDHCPDLTVATAPGNHISLLTGEQASALGELLTRHLGGRPDDGGETEVAS